MKTISLLSSIGRQHQRRRCSGMMVPLCHIMLTVLILSSSGSSSNNSGNNNSGCLSFVSSFTATSTSSSRTARFSLRNKGSHFLGQSVSSSTDFRATGGSKRGITGLSMHMGHSHSHHHHHDHSHNEAPKLSRSQRQKKRRRRAAMFVFAALAILGPPFIRNKFTGVGRTDVAIFVLTSVILSTSDSIRRELVYMINKMKNLRQGLIKHAPQPSEYAETNSKRKSKIRQLLAYIDIPFLNKNDAVADAGGMTISGGSAGAVALSPSYEASMSVTDEREEADNVTILGVIVNLLLSLGKFVVGVTCNSSALIADAGHSLSDLFSDFVTLYTVQIARLPPDDDHPYGHGKFEAIGSLFLSLTLLGTGISIGAMANKELIQVLTTQHKNNAAAVAALKIPKPPALIMAGMSILSKEWLFQITNKVGQKLNSQIVIANAWHHRSDAYSSVLALVSIGLAMYIPGLLAADAAAGLLVAGMIGMTGGEILVDSINQLSDSTNTYIQQQVDDIIQNYTANNGDIINVDKIRARSVGGASAVVDVSITISSDILSTSATRVVEENIKRRILDELGNSVVDVIVRAVSVAPTPTVQQQKVDSLSLRNAAASSLSQQEQSQSSSTQLAQSEDVVDVGNGGESSSNSNIATNEAAAAATLDDSHHHNHDHGHDHHEHSHDHDHHDSHDHGGHNHDHDHALGGAYQDCGEELPCVSQIETNLRQTLLEHPDIDSVKSMTVNYIDINNKDNDNESDALLSSSSSSVAVDVVIGLNDDQDNMSIQHAKQVVKEARESIINNEHNMIEDANIYLDFNDDQNDQIESISIDKDEVESKEEELLTTATTTSTVSTINGDMGGAATNTTTLTATHTYKP